MPVPAAAACSGAGGVGAVVFCCGGQRYRLCLCQLVPLSHHVPLHDWLLKLRLPLGGTTPNPFAPGHYRSWRCPPAPTWATPRHAKLMVVTGCPSMSILELLSLRRQFRYLPRSGLALWKLICPIGCRCRPMRWLLQLPLVVAAVHVRNLRFLLLCR